MIQRLIRSATTRNIKHGASRKAHFVRRQPRHQIGDFLHFAKAVHRDLGQHKVDMLLRHLREHAGFNGCGRDAVHFNLGAGKLFT